MQCSTCGVCSSWQCPQPQHIACDLTWQQRVFGFYKTSTDKHLFCFRCSPSWQSDLLQKRNQAIQNIRVCQPCVMAGGEWMKSLERNLVDTDCSPQNTWQGNTFHSSPICRASHAGLSPHVSPLTPQGNHATKDHGVPKTGSTAGLQTMDQSSPQESIFKDLSDCVPRYRIRLAELKCAVDLLNTQESNTVQAVSKLHQDALNLHKDMFERVSSLDKLSDLGLADRNSRKSMYSEIAGLLDEVDRVKEDLDGLKHAALAMVSSKTASSFSASSSSSPPPPPLPSPPKTELRTWCESNVLPETLTARLEADMFQHPSDLAELREDEINHLCDGLKLGHKCCFKRLVKSLKANA